MAQDSWSSRGCWTPARSAALFLLVEVGQYLPDWRPEVDYRTTVTASRSLGGGPLLELSHELDLARALLGMPVSVSAHLARVGDLAIDTEDTADLILRHASRQTGRPAVSSIHLDILQQPLRRELRLTGTEGTLQLDLAAGTLLRIATDGGASAVPFRAALRTEELYRAELGISSRRSTGARHAWAWRTGSPRCRSSMPPGGRMRPGSRSDSGRPRDAGADRRLHLRQGRLEGSARQEHPAPRRRAAHRPCDPGGACDAASRALRRVDRRPGDRRGLAGAGCGDPVRATRRACHRHRERMAGVASCHPHASGSGTPVGTFVSVPATAPLRTPDDLAACIAAFDDGDADVVITVTEAHRNPSFNMVTIDDGGRATLVIPPVTPVANRQAAPSVYDMTTVGYVADPDFILAADGIFSGRVRAVVVPAERAIDIDTDLDFRIAELLLADRASVIR